MNDRWVARARLVLGGVILFAAVIAWFMGFMMSPHEPASTGQTDYVRSTVVVFLRNSAVGNLVLCALAAWLLFPAWRPLSAARDWTIFAVIAVIVLTSVYQLLLLRSVAH